jgi:hypothetical protein
MLKTNAYQQPYTMLKKTIKYQISEKNSRKIGCFQDIVFSGYFHYTHWVLSGCRDYYIYSQNGILI